MSNIGHFLAASVIIEHLEARRNRIDDDASRLEGTGRGRVDRRYRRQPKRTADRER